MARKLVLWVTPCLPALACGPGPQHPAETPAPPPRSVTTVTVDTEAERGRVIAGTIVARERASLRSRMAATVLELPFAEGDTVRSGSIVVRLDDEALRSALAGAEAGLAAARADRDRMERLLERDAATPRETEGVRARAAAAEADVEAARDALRNASPRAPFAGRVTRRLVHEGDVVSPGQALIEIEGDRGYELRASVDATAAASMAPGTELAVEVEGVATGGASDILVATVRAVTPAGDPGTHRFEVVADLSAAEGLRSGLYARLRLPPVPGDAALLTIPAGATFARGGLTGVYVVDDGIARLRWIAPGRIEGERLAVRAGLEAGDRVVLDPSGLDDGDPVTEDR